MAGFLHLQGLPYRCIIAVLGAHMLTLWDTQHLHRAIAVISNIHIALLTDVTWSPDGSVIMVSSQDGYLSFLRFDSGELGRQLVQRPVQTAVVPTLQEKMIAAKEAITLSRTPKSKKQVARTRNVSGGSGKKDGSGKTVCS